MADEYFTMRKGAETMENVHVSVIEAHKQLGWTVVEVTPAKASSKKPKGKVDDQPPSDDPGDNKPEE